MALTVRSRVTALTVLVVAVAVGVAAFGASVLVEQPLEEGVVRRLEAEARVVAAALPADAGDLRSFVRGLGERLDERITLVAPDGTVLADSQADPARLENHATRPEILAARDLGVGVSQRRSESLGRPLFYVAVHVDRPGGPVAFVRLSLPADRAEEPVRRLRLVLLLSLAAGTLAALVAGAGAAGWLGRRVERLADVAHAVARGGPEAGRRLPLPEGDEFGPLERALAATATDLSTYVNALAEQRRRIEAIIGSMDEGLVVVTEGGEVLLMNGVAERLLDVRPEAWRGRRLLELTRHPDLHAVLARAGSEQRASGEVRLAAPREVDLAVSVSPLLEGTPERQPPAEGLGYVVVLRDVTRLKRLERVRTDFVANVSHELKTPLAAIRAALETLHDWALEDPAGARRWVAVSLAHAERLQRLIDDLLVLSDLELRQVRLDRRRVDLGGAVDETFDLLSGKAEARGVRLVRAIPAAFPPLLVDRNRLIQILVNLVDNAVKFTPRGGTVTVSGEVLADGMRAVVVADTGLGVPRADLSRLGERFYRVDKGRARDAGGTGLGLAIVKHLTQMHGGRLEITSEVGRGTTVRVVLPPGPAGEAAARGV